MVPVHFYDNCTESKVDDGLLPGVPRVGDIVEWSASVDCRVESVVWQSNAPYVRIYLTPVQERFHGKKWWS